MSHSGEQIIIIGAGLAGLFTALKLAPLPVTLVSPKPLGHGASSSWAQGGIAAAMGEGDHPDKHILDTIKVGAGIVDENMASIIAYEARARIEDLLSYGVPFDKDLEGKLKLSREAAHSEKRIVRVKGDMAGKAIMASLISAVKQTPSITVMEGYSARDLSVHDGRISGVYLSKENKDGTGSTHLRLAHAVVLASGGVGGLYEVSTNPLDAKGQGLGMAARAGAIIADPEFIQFHPTALNVGLSPAPLATEALRGEGATLIDGNNHRFMPDYHKDAELAPRDVVARAVFEKATHGTGAFLDCREAIGEKFKDHYPTVYEKCLSVGIDPVQDPIPVAPAAHYHMGGILTNETGRTSVDGLWACGEVASTGTHGGNRLASNSLLEAVVFAHRIAEDLKGIDIKGGLYSKPNSEYESQTQAACERITQSFGKIKQYMSKYLGVIRDEDGLKKAVTKFDQLHEQRLSSLPLDNMLTTARLIAKAALIRKESRGAHKRSDWPHERDAYARRSYLQMKDMDIIEVEPILGRDPQETKDAYRM